MVAVRTLKKRTGLCLGITALVIGSAPNVASRKDLRASKRLEDVDELLLKPIGTAESGCFVRRAYGLVRIKRIVAHGEAMGKSRIPIVAITSPADGWSGIVTGLALLPILPRDAKLTQQRGADFFRSRAIEFNNKRALAPINGYTIERNTTVQVLRQDPPDGNHNDLYVRVLTGAHRGELVWTTLHFFPASYWMQDPANIVP